MTKKVILNPIRRVAKAEVPFALTPPPVAQEGEQPSLTNISTKMTLRVGLDVLLKNGFVSTINVTRPDLTTYASIYMDGNDITVTGTGINILRAVEDLNQKVLDLNFAL